jgi:hypothetical protein
MTLNYPEIFVPSLLSFVLVLYVVPWHLRIRNIATLSMSFWMLALNLVHIINRVSMSDIIRSGDLWLIDESALALLWNSTNERKATVYGDICKCWRANASRPLY